MKDSKTLLNEHLFPTKYCLRLLDCKHLFSSLPPSPLGGIPSLSNPSPTPPQGWEEEEKGGGGRGFGVIYGCLHPPPSSSHTHFIQPLLISIHFPFDLSVCLFFLRESGCVLLHEEGNCQLHFTHARSRQSCKKRGLILLYWLLFSACLCGGKEGVCAMRCFLRRHPTPPHPWCVLLGGDGSRVVAKWRRQKKSGLFYFVHEITSFGI